MEKNFAPFNLSKGFPIPMVGELEIETIPPLLNMRSHQQVDSPGHDEEGHEEVGHGQRHDQEVGRRPQHLLL